MVHNHYLEEAKKKTQESSRNSEPSVMPSARSQSTENGSKPKPRINNQKSRNWPASKSSCVTTKTVPIAEHSRNSRSFSDSKHFVCSTCQKCVFNANHDSCVTKFLNEVNSRAKVPSNKTTNRNKPVEKISVAKKPERQIPKRHRSSIKKTSVVHEKIMTPRSGLRWKPTGKIFKTVGLRWVPTGKIFISSTTKVDSDPTNGSDEDITNQYECEQTLDVSAGTLNLSTEHPSDTYVLTMKMEILLEPASNKLLVVYQGRLLASFQDDAKYEHVGQDTRSQGGKDDQDKQGKDLKISDIKTKSKDNDKGSRSKITKHEGTSLQRIQRPRPQDLNDKSNLIDLMKECHNELTSGEIVSLKILSRTRKFVHYIRSRSLN
ncbi:hypothetical protein Tco_0842134 [Tanacetum coccineum]|uniref:Uncharacterized protein n=1 Tax=Tanacetum coccineum TaxID=301880 RepID=A0ABQ5B145_9ASTR